MIIDLKYHRVPLAVEVGVGVGVGGMLRDRVGDERIAVDTSVYLMYRNTVHAYCPHTLQGNS